MNQLNYGTLEACKKLHNAGIVLETDMVWASDFDGSLFLTDHITDQFLGNGVNLVWPAPTLEEALRELGVNLVCPAPTLAEVWRELPLDTWLRKVGELTKIMNEDNSFFEYDDNPTDAAIYLLIWLKEKGLYEPQRNV